MSSPNTVMRPESGLMSPSASFRIRLLPEPATPNIAFVSPRGRWKEIPRNTSLLPKASDTSSNTMAGAELSFAVIASESRGRTGVDMRLLIRKRSHQEASDDQVHREDQNRGRYHRLRSGLAYALRSAARIHSVEAAYGGDDETENYWLDQSHKYILKHKGLPGVVPVLPGVEF